MPDGWGGIIGHLVRVREDQAPAHRARLRHPRPLTPTAAQQSPRTRSGTRITLRLALENCRTHSTPTRESTRQVPPGYLHPIPGTDDTTTAHRMAPKAVIPPVHNLRDRIATVCTQGDAAPQATGISS
ncbi:MAG: hypothetical protein EOP24_46455 [Hyphomicrobiales bacterium]|nr:MAG: hypothetical protein EOP24_46455 [Hyphomicrobiales bacterium]